MALTKKYMTEDGFELHMATNHFGHFFLTNLLLPLLAETARDNQDLGRTSVRIVVVSSLAHFWGQVDVNNLNSERFYDVKQFFPFKRQKKQKNFASVGQADIRNNQAG